MTFKLTECFYHRPRHTVLIANVGRHYICRLLCRIQLMTEKYNMASDSEDYDRTDEIDGCATCMKECTVTCTGCNNIKYCSEACQQQDAEQHNTLCNTFKDFQTRPSDKHFQALYPPADEPKPQFIWLLMEGARRTWKPNPTNLAKYVPGSPSSEDSFITYHVAFRMIPARIGTSLGGCVSSMIQCPRLTQTTTRVQLPRSSQLICVSPQ